MFSFHRAFAFGFLVWVVCQASFSDGLIAAAQAGDREYNSFPLLARIASEEPLDLVQSRLLAKRLRNFAVLLEQKLLAAAPETRQSYAPLIDRIQGLPPARSISPDDTLYDLLQMIRADIGGDIILVMTYEEMLRSEKKDVPATVQPDRGPGASYGENEPIRFNVSAARDCYIQVYALTAEPGSRPQQRYRLFLLYPEKSSGSFHLRRGQTLVLGKSGKIIVQKPYGRDPLFVVASPEPLRSSVLPEVVDIPVPLRFHHVLATLYGRETAANLSVSSGFFVSSSPEFTGSKTRGRILTEAEAATLRLDAGEWMRPPLRLRSRQPAGPRIMVREPTLTDEQNPTIVARSPIDLVISFEQNRAPVDMDSLEVRARKGFLSMSITDRVREYLHGTVLDARQLDFPSGKFRIQLKIADVNGVETTREYRLEVR